MGRSAYQHELKARIQDLGFDIDRIRRRLDHATDGHLKVDLMGRLSGLERRRRQLENRLDMLKNAPERNWSNLRAQLSLEWTSLMQDFEERVARLL